MEAHQILQPLRWQILTCISEGNNNATGIAKTLDRSLASIDQQLKFMELIGVISRERQKTKKIGKPFNSYIIAQEMYMQGILKKDFVKFSLQALPEQASFLSGSAFLDSAEDKYFIQKFYFTHEEFILSTEIITILPSSIPDEIHLFVIAKEVNSIREKNSSMVVKSPLGTKKKFVLWSHTAQEVIDGLKRHEQYYCHKVRESVVIFQNKEEKFDTYKKLLSNSNAHGT